MHFSTELLIINIKFRQFATFDKIFQNIKNTEYLMHFNNIILHKSQSGITAFIYFF